MSEDKKEGLLGRLMSAQDPTRDMKLAAFGLTVVASIGWLTWKAKGSLTDQWVNAYYGLCALVGLGGTAWAAVDKWRKKDEAEAPKTEGKEEQA